MNQRANQGGRWIAGTFACPSEVAGIGYAYHQAYADWLLVLPALRGLKAMIESNDSRRH